MPANGRWDLIRRLKVKIRVHLVRLAHVCVCVCVLVCGGGGALCISTKQCKRSVNMHSLHKLSNVGTFCMSVHKFNLRSSWLLSVEVWCCVSTFKNC